MSFNLTLMNNIQTSILIPSYNCEPLLLECIGSILRQEYKRYEIIIIDDYSTDNTMQVIDGIKKITDNIFYFRNPGKKGLIYALNYGISKCRGKYIARMDADDLMVGNRLTEQTLFLENNPDYVAVCSSMQLIDKNGLFLSNKILFEDDSFNIFMLLFCNVFVHGSMTIRKEVLEENPYDEEFMYCEDYELWTRITKVDKIKCLSSIHHLYRIYESSSKTAESMRIQRANVLKLYASILNNYNIDFDKDELLLHFMLFNSSSSLIPKERILSWLDKILYSPNIHKVFGKEFLKAQRDYLHRSLSLTTN